MLQRREQTIGEEIASSVTHGLGLVASVGGLAVLVVLAAVTGDAWRVVVASVYGGTLVLLYATSTMYHALPAPAAKRVLRRLDHAAIYLLIAGTYTPFTLVNLRGPWGWTLFGLVWGLAALGVTFKAVFGPRLPALSTTVYVLMGWIVLVAIGPLSAHLQPEGITWLVAGGLLYTAGVGFFAWRRLLFGHAIWHCFVLAGSACHYAAILGYVIRPAS